MATYEEELDIQIPLPSISETVELGRTPFDQEIPLPSIYESTAYYEVENVAAAFLYDHSAPSYTDYTDEANDPVSGDVPLLLDVGAGSVGDGFLVGAASKFDFITFEINTAGVGSYAIPCQYWNGTGWTTIGVPTGLIYTTINSFKTTWLVRATLKEQPADWAAMTVDGKYCYYLFFEWQSGTYTVAPIADQIWLGRWTVAYTATWSDIMTIDDSAETALVFGVSPVWSDHMDIDDTKAGQFSLVKTFIREWSDLMIITDLTDTEGMHFQINVVFDDLLDMSDELDMEMLAKYFSRSWTDTMSISDDAPAGLIFEFAKIFSDVFTITDTGGLVFNFGLNLSDIMDIVDLGIREWGFAIDFHDIMTIVDSILWQGDYPAPVYLRFSARRPQITIYTKEVKKK